MTLGAEPTDSEPLNCMKVDCYCLVEVVVLKLKRATQDKPSNTSYSPRTLMNDNVGMPAPYGHVRLRPGLGSLFKVPRACRLLHEVREVIVARKDYGVIPLKDKLFVV